MARAPTTERNTARDDRSTDPRNAHVAAMDAANTAYLEALLRGRGGPAGVVPLGVAAGLQSHIGNAATTALVAGDGVAGAEQEAAFERLEAAERAADEEDEDAEDHRVADAPEPADPADAPGLEDEAAQASDTPPAQSAASRAPPPSPAPSGGGGGGGGAAPVIASGGGAQGVVQAAQETAAAMPAPQSGSAATQQNTPRRRARRRVTRRQIAGPPPVPRMNEDFARVHDPVDDQTKAIEEVSNKELTARRLPPVPATPGENTPPLPARHLEQGDFRILRMGEQTMNDARLSHRGDPPMPGETAGGDTRAELSTLRRELLGLPPDEETAAPPPLVQTAEPTETSAATEATEGPVAEELPPGVIEVTQTALPPTDITLAEREMLVAAAATLKANSSDTAEGLLSRIKDELAQYRPALTVTTYDAIKKLGKNFLPDLEGEIDGHADQIAGVLGVAGAALDEAVAERRRAREAQNEADAAAAAGNAAQTQADAQAQSGERQADIAAANQAAADAQSRAQAMGPPPEPGFHQIAETAVRRIQTKVSEAVARYEFSGKQQKDALDAAKARWISALELGVIADQFDAERAAGLTPGASHPPDLSAAHRNAITTAFNTARRWKAQKTTEITAEVARLKRDVDSEVARYVRDVQAAGATAFQALRDWGNSQDDATGTWWQTQAADLQTWADNAQDTAATWTDVEARIQRLELQNAARQIRDQIDAEMARSEENSAAYNAMTEDRRRNFTAENILNDTRFLQVVGAPMIGAVFAANKATMAPKIEQQLFKLPESEWRALNEVARAGNSNFDARQRAQTIFDEGYDKWARTGEAEIFTAMSGLRTVERLALTGAYNVAVAGRPNALYTDLSGEFSGHEWRRAQHLMAGRHGAAAAEAVHDAVFGPGTGEEQVYQALETLTRLPEPERSRQLAFADAEYQRRYGASLSTRLREDFSGSERGRALALAAGNIDDARAHQLQYALGSSDANAAAQVYTDIQNDVLQTGRREGWTPTEFAAALAERNSALETSFGRAYGNHRNYNWGDRSTLQEAITWNFLADEGSRRRLQALQAGDLAAADAGRMQSERRSTYADDDVMGAVVSAQYTRASEMVDLERGYELRRDVTRRLNAEVRQAENSNTPMTAEQIQDRRMALDREVSVTLANAAFDRASRNVDALDQAVQENYGLSLDEMVTSTMSDNLFTQGGDLTTARARLNIMRNDERKPGVPDTRRLDWAYTSIRSSIEGAGTDVQELRATMSGLTKEEMEQLDARWRTDHNEETLRSALEWDTSGRDEGDLVDMFEHGMPMTVAAKVGQLRRQLDRDEENVGWLGAFGSRHQAAASHDELAHLEDIARQMRDPNLPLADRRALGSAFDTQHAMVGNAIAAQRKAVDAFADVATTVVGYVVSAIIIAAAAVATVASGGTASPSLLAAISIAGSIIGTVSGMATKYAIKGSDYSMEEFGSDLAIGVVDLALTIATAGLMRGGAGMFLQNSRVLFAAAREEMRAISKMALLKGAQEVMGDVAQTTVTAGARRALREGAETTLSQRARAYAQQQALDVAMGVPAVLTGTVLNEQTWREGNPALNILRGTWEGSLQNLRDGVIMGGASHLAERGVRAMRRPREMSRTEVQQRDIRHWRHANPDASPGDYARFIESYAALNSNHADTFRAAQRAARRSLLSEIPPRERGAVADVPIIHVSDTEFTRFNGGNFGDAFVHVHDGQAVIVIRDGAPASAVSRLGPSLRDVVAPGTRGRSVNPGDSLPARLRERVDVETVRDPSFGADEVRAVPVRDDLGDIVGVSLQVGPNARAIDIQMHVDTIDAMRRYIGLAGRIRMFLNRIGRRFGADITDPSDMGRWQAQLEIAKLPRIIEERIGRLSERGLDPRRRAIVMQEIAHLEHQFRVETERALLGSGAEDRGFVAAQPQGDLETQSAAQPQDDGPAQSPPAEDGPSPATDAPVAAADAQHTGIATSLARAMRATEARLAHYDRVLYEAQGEHHSAAQNYVIDQADNYTNALEIMREHASEALHPFIDGSHTRWQSDLSANHLAMIAHPDFAAARAALRPRERNYIDAVGRRLEILGEFHNTRRRIERQTRVALSYLEALQSQFSILDSNGLGIALHPSLPDPNSHAGYRPERRLLRKLQKEIDPTMAETIVRAIIDKFDQQDPRPLHEILAGTGAVQALLNADRGNKQLRTLDDLLATATQHRDGYRSELSLASQIAEGGQISLAADRALSSHVVLDYGDLIGRNFADVLSVDADGNVFLWDSKFSSEGSQTTHSKTFTDDTRRAAAIEVARDIINDAARNGTLSEAARDAAIANIEDMTFTCVTSHTNNALVFHRHGIQEFVRGVETSRTRVDIDGD